MPPTVPEVETFPVLKGKVAIVTGAARGMGKATVELFLKAGATVVMCDVMEKEGEEAAKELSQFGEVIFVKADISKSEEVKSLVEKTVAWFGKLDTAVNNAALAPDTAPLIDFDEDHWSRIIDVNLKGTALCCKWQMQQMIKQGHGGSIINIASINSFKPRVNMPAYTAAKHALLGLTKHAAMEGGAHSIRVNSIAPAAIYSEMATSAIKSMGTTEEEFAKTFILLKRFGLPREVAQGSLWLASDASTRDVSSDMAHGPKGIGAAIVRNLASKGCNIIVNHATERSKRAAANLCNELQTAHSECTKLVDAARTHFTDPETGKAQLDILVHNAAIGYFRPFESVTEADFHTMYAVNVLGPILLTQEFLPLLPTDRSGRIVMVSSINSKVGPEGTTIYTGTKGALEATARVLCRELAERATVNIVNPGPVITDMYLTSSDSVKQALAKWNPMTPLAPVRSWDSPEAKELGRELGGRPGYDYEIAGLVSLLCSPEAGWCTGSMLSANGGLSFSL
ncbi:NAD(P)-binding protein [Daldinia bambusicola]|nr:NAD(P)-binding protein [Daldinia bambusicola]